jgi:hypothetical protein
MNLSKASHPLPFYDLRLIFDKIPYIPHTRMSLIEPSHRKKRIRKNAQNFSLTFFILSKK